MATNKEIPAGYQTLYEAQERAKKEGWRNWETAYLVICIETLPDIERNVYIALKGIAHLDPSRERNQLAVSILQQWVLTEKYTVIDWEALALHFITKIRDGWIPASFKNA